MRRRNKPARYKESFLQEQFSLWLDMKGILFNASMAGVFLGIPAAIRRKKMGAKKGFPDIFIYHAVPPYHGLAIELKAEDGKVEKGGPQEEWRANLEAHGYKALIMPPGMDYATGLEWLKQMTQLYLYGTLKNVILNEGR